MAQEESNELRGAALTRKTNSSEPRTASAHAEEVKAQKRLSQLVGAGCC